MREASPFITDTHGVIQAAHLDAFRQANSKKTIAKDKLWLSRLAKKKEPTMSYEEQKKDAEDAAAQFRAIQARKRKLRAKKAAES